MVDIRPLLDKTVCESLKMYSKIWSFDWRCQGMAKKKKETKPAIFSAAGLIKFSEEEVADIHLDPKIAFVASIVIGAAILILYMTHPI